MGVWVEELGRVLSGRSLAIWEGTSGLPADREAAYRTLWRAQARGEPPPRVGTIPCIYLGASEVGLRECPGCRGRVRLKEFACTAGQGVGGRAVPPRDCGPGRCGSYRPRGEA